MYLLANFGLFQIGWFSSVLGGANQMPWLGPIVVVGVIAAHLSLAYRPGSEVALILICGAIGAAFDSLLVSFGWVRYPSGMFADYLAPYWIIGMWLLFATTLNVSLGWLKPKPLLSAILGLVAGPLTYLGGAKLGGIEFTNTSAAILVLGIGWAVIMPAVLVIADKFNGVTPVATSNSVAA